MKTFEHFLYSHVYSYIFSMLSRLGKPPLRNLAARLGGLALANILSGEARKSGAVLVGQWEIWRPETHPGYLRIAGEALDVFFPPVIW